MNLDLNFFNLILIGVKLQMWREIKLNVENYWAFLTQLFY